MTHRAAEQVFELQPPGAGVRVFLLATALLPLGLLGLFVYIAASVGGARLEVTAAEVRVTGALYGRAWSRDSFVAESARVADFRQEPALSPALRTHGMALPGYAEGWFRLRSGQSALVFATGSEVVVVDTGEGYLLLFGAAQAQAAAQAFRRGTGTFPLAPPSASAAPLFAVLGAAVCLPLVALLYATFRAASATRFIVTPAGLRITGSLFPGKPLRTAELRLDSARVVDLTRDARFGVRWRLWGAGLPGYTAGWCYLRNGEKALVQLTRRSPVLYLPTTQGHSLLLSAASPDALLAALREQSAA